MFCEPKRSAYANYGDFTMAVLGYACITLGVAGGSCTGLDDSLGARSCLFEGGCFSHLVGSVEGTRSAPLGEGISGGCRASVDRRVVDCSVDGESVSRVVVEEAVAGVDRAREGVESGLPGGLTSGCGIAVSEARGCVGSSVGRGPNFERNRKNREAQKARKARRKAMDCDWRVRRAGASTVRTDVPAVSAWVEDSGKVVDKQGFWNSCSGAVRQELIDSKARMHIAENKRRERENLEKLEEMDSPYALASKVMSMVKLADAAAKRAGDSKVAGWVQTVTNSYSESIAKSVPSTVQSFDSFVESSVPVVSSVESVPLEDHIAVLKKVTDLEGKLQQSQQSTTSLVSERQVLQLQLENEFLKIDNKYAKLGSYDPYMLQSEKKMVRRQKKFSKLDA